MRLKHLAAAMPTIASIAAVSSPAWAQSPAHWCTWDDPCPTNDCDRIFDFCICQAAWANADNWVYDPMNCPSPYYPGSGDKAVIQATTRGAICDGQDETDNDEESWLEIAISTLTIAELEVQAGSSDPLRLVFYNGGTLTVTGPIEFYAGTTSADLVVHVEGGTKIQSD